MESSMSSILLDSLKSLITAGNLEDLREAFTKCQSNGVDPFQEKSPSLFHVASMIRDCSLGILEELITQFRRLSKKSSRKGSGLIAFLHDSLTPEEGYTALHCACKYNKLDYVYVFVKELRFYGIEPPKLNSCAVARKVFTPFEVACKYECHKVALFLLQKCGGIYDDFSSGLVIMFGKNSGKELIKEVCSDHKVNVKTLNSLLCQKRCDIVKFCMEEKLCKQKGKQLMQMAVSQGETDLINYLLELDNREIYTTPDKGGVNLMHIACDEHQLGSTACLVNAGYAVMAVTKNKKGRRPFSIAIGNGFEDIVDLLKQELRVNPLHLFLFRTSYFLEQSKVELEELTDCDPFEQDACGNTALHYACQDMLTYVIDILLAKPRLDLSIRNSNSDTPGHLLLREILLTSKKIKSTEAASLLAGENPRRRNMNLHNSQKKGLLSFKMMIKHSTFNPTLLNVEKESIVFTLLTNSNYDVLSSNDLSQVLNIATKCYCNNSLSKDVLRIVTHYCRYDYYVCSETSLKDNSIRFTGLIAELTNQTSFNPNITDLKGNTCLHYAAASACTRLVEHFLNLPNTSVDAKNNKGLSPLKNMPRFLKISQLIAACDVYSKLIEKMALVDLEDKDEKGNTLLHLACTANSVSLLKSIAGKNSFQTILNKKNKKGETPLHLLCSRAKKFVSIECFEILLRFSEIDVNLCNESGETPLSILTSHIIRRKPIMYEGIKKSILLLAEHCSFNLELYTSPNYLQIWCQVGKADFFQEVHKSSGDFLLSSLNDFRQNFLHIACLNFNSKVVKYLLALPCASDLFLARDYFNRTPFHSFCWRVWVSREEFNEEEALASFMSIIGYKSIGDIVNDEIDGETAFDLLCSPCHQFTEFNVKLLKELLNVPNIDSKVQNRYYCEEKLLLQHSGVYKEEKMTNNSCHVERLLFDNIHHKEPEEFKKLYDFCDSENGNTTLHLACKLMKKEAVSLLLSEANACVGRTNKKGQTCLHALFDNVASFFPLALDNDLYNGIDDVDFENFIQIFEMIKSHSTYTSEVLCIKDDNGEDFLYLACKASMLYLVNEIIDTKPELVLQKNKKGNNPLHVACTAKNAAEIVSLLLKLQGIDLSDTNNEKETVFHIVAAIRKHEIYCLLRAHSSFCGSVLLKKNAAGDTCLHVACHNFYSSTVYKMILDIKNSAADLGIINIQNNRGQTALHLCPELILNGDLANSFDLAIQDRLCNNPIFVLLKKLWDLCRGHYLHFKKELLPSYDKLVPSDCLQIWEQVIKVPSFEACINQTNAMQETILHFICGKFHNDLILKEKMIDSILSFQTCDTTIINKAAQTPFHILAKHNRKLFDRICRKHSNISLCITDNGGNTPLHILCNSLRYVSISKGFNIDKLVTDEPENLCALYENADTSITNKNGDTALHMACSITCPYYVRCFLRTSNVNLQNYEGETPFRCLKAYEAAFSRCWQILVAHPSFDPNIQDDKQKTILHYECEAGNPDFSLIEHLLSREDIDLSLTTSDNHTCLDLAKANANCKQTSRLLGILKQHDITFSESLSFSQFLNPHHGLFQHDESICTLLLQEHCTVRCNPLMRIGHKDCNTALHLACQAVCPTVIIKLLRSCKRSMTNFPVNNSEQTPLHVLALGIKEQVNYFLTKEFMRDVYEENISYVKGKVRRLNRHDWRILLQCGINKQDELGNTALHYVCEAQSVTMLRVLTSDVSCKFDIHNNAGKLPITVAQESGNRGFYLKFLIKYFESQGNEAFADYYRAVLEDSATISMTPVKCILTGPPGAGKTTLKQRLLGEKFTETTSTGVSDSPQVIAVRNVSQEQVLSSSSDNMKWTPVDCRDQIEALLETVSSRAHNAIKKASSSQPFLSATSSLISLAKPNMDYIKSTTSIAIVKHFKSSYPQWQQKQQQMKVKSRSKSMLGHRSLEKQLKKLRTLANSVRTTKSKNDPCKFTVSDLEKNPFVRIIDTGGQPELHELLPAFITGPAINLIVFNLQLPLQEQFPIYCRSESDGNSIAYKSCINHEDMILRSLSSIACLGYGSHIPSAKELDDLHCTHSGSPAAFLIGSHKDLVSDGKINDINKHLISLIKKCNPEIVKYYIYSGNCHVLLYPINGRDKFSKEIDTLRQHISETVKLQFEKFPVPMTWLILSIMLQVKLQKGETQNVISIDDCFEIAEKCGFENIKQLKSALWFFHNVMGTVMYFPHIPELNSKVILDLQAIFDCITKLITSCFIYKTVMSKDAEEDFSRRGIFTLENLERVFKPPRHNYPFSAQEIIALLKHLYAIVAIEKGKYFMPTSLAPTDLSDLHQDTSIPPPLLISFDCGYTPVGIFGSLVTCLLSDANIECCLDDRSQQYRNKIQLVAGSWRDEITLISRAKFLEVILKRMNPKASSSLADIRMAIDEGIKAVTESFHYKIKAKHFFGFACSCELLPQHPAICEDIETKSIRCLQTNDHVMMPLNDAQLAWFDIQQEHVEGLPNLPNDLLQKTLGIDDLDDVVDALKDLIEWKELGLKLGLRYPTLDKIEVNKLNKVDDCKMEMLACWLRKQDKVKSKNGPSWEQLIKVLYAMKKSDIVENVIRVLHDINKSVKP